MQERLEKQYLARLTLERENTRLHSIHPVICRTPAASGTVMRALRRLLPALRRRQDRAWVAGSGLFDAQWYLDTYPDVAHAGTDPLNHFMVHATADQRSPGPHFDTPHYLALYPDIAAHGLNPLVHYLRAGWFEQRAIRPGMPTGLPARTL
jgi:hypothetical protein